LVRSVCGGVTGSGVVMERQTDERRPGPKAERGVRGAVALRGTGMEPLRQALLYGGEKAN
jgi:hypothetical protein